MPIDATAPPPSAEAEAIPRSSGWFDAIANPRVAVAGLTAFGLLIFVLNLGAAPLYTKGEPREAVTILDIATGGGVILPMRAGVELPSKPLLMHWMAALLSVAAASVNEWTVRLPSALLAIAGILVCYYYVRRLFDERIALLSALTLGATFQYLQAGTGARVDMTLTFFMEVAFFEFIMMAERLTSRRILLYVALAMAVLAKGPVGVVLPGAVALVWMALTWRWEVISRMSLGPGALIVAVLAGWWYVAAAIVGGAEFVHKQLVVENLVRFVGGPGFHEGHVHPFYYLELALLGGFLPWTPMLALAAVRTARAPRLSDPRLSYLLVWVAVVLAFYSFSHSKRGIYLLPVYPALAAIAALYLADAIENPQSSARVVAFLSSAYGVTLAATAAAAILGLAMLWIAPSAMAWSFGVFGIADREFTAALVAAAKSQLALSAVIPVALLTLGAYLARSAKTAQKMALAVAGGMGLAVVAANAIVVPAIANTLSLKQFSADTIAAVDSHSVAYLNALDYDVAFYSRRNIPIVSLKDANHFDYLICWETIWMGMPESERAQSQVVITSNPTDLDGSGRMVLLRRAAPGEPPSSGERP